MDNIKKRKKRKSLVQTVKKKFKNNFSRTLGTRLDSDVYEYFLRVFQQSKQEFPNAEERCIFIDNVFSQTEGHEIEYATNQLVSRIIEGFLPECNESTFQRYLTAFGKDLRPLCSHQFASHVLETLLKIASKKVLNSQSSSDEEKEKNTLCENSFPEDCMNFVVKVSKFLLNNIDEFMLDTYANHVARSAILCLGGDVGEINKDSRNFNKSDKEGNGVLQVQHKKFYPSEFKVVLQQYAEMILNSHMFTEYANNILMSGLVQSMLLSLQSAGIKKYLNRISLKLLDIVFFPEGNNIDVLDTLMRQQAVHLLNTVIITSTNKVYKCIHSKCLSGRLKDMALSKTANYCVQKLIEKSTEVALFDSIYDELHDIFEKIIENRLTGTLHSICKMCHKLQTKEKAFVKDMMRALEPNSVTCCGKETNNFCLRLLTVGGKNNNDDAVGTDNLLINLHGCLILQEMLKFSKPEKVIKNLLEIDASLFLRILCDQKGSHISNAFFSNEMIKEKYRNKFLEKLKGSYVFLATNKYGSFVLTAAWNSIDVHQKICIVSELANKESLLWNNPSGRIIARTVALETYQHQPKEWESAQKQIINSRALFSDIIK